MQQDKRKYKAAPRASWNYYGLTDKKYRKKLKQMMQSSKYASLARSTAYTVNKDIAEYILLSVIKNKSYEEIEYADGLGRIPCGKTDFYGYRRLFYSLFDRELGRIENERSWFMEDGADYLEWLKNGTNSPWIYIIILVEVWGDYGGKDGEIRNWGNKIFER